MHYRLKASPIRFNTSPRMVRLFTAWFHSRSLTFSVTQNLFYRTISKTLSNLSLNFIPTIIDRYLNP